MAKNKLNLLADFPPVSTQEWMEKITADLKGADFGKKLIWKTSEGFNVLPFYRADNTNQIQGSGIGLSIALRILEKNHIRYEITSETDKGTTVTLSL